MIRMVARAYVIAGALGCAGAFACATAGVAGEAPQPRADTVARGARTEAAREDERAAAPARGRVVVDLVGIDSSDGQVLVALFRDGRGFPDRAEAFARAVRPARPGTLSIVFDPVPAGPIAVAVHHDADGDFAMDTGLFGMPSEGYGFSRDARAPFGPPDFAASRVVLDAGQQQRIRIHLRY